MNVQPELLRAVVAAIQATPEWQYLREKIEAAAPQAKMPPGGPQALAHDGLAPVGSGAESERYSEERIALAAVEVHTEALRRGHVMQYTEAEREARKRIAEDAEYGAPVLHERYTADSAEEFAAVALDKYQERLADEAIALATAAVNRGESMTYDEAEDLARYRRLRNGLTEKYARERAPVGDAAATDKYEQRLCDEAVKVHGEALARGESWDWGKCEAHARGRLQGAAA